MSLRIQRNVSLASATEHKRAVHDWTDVDRMVIPHRFRRGGRVGTIRLTLEDFAAKFGNPHESVPPCDWRKYDDLPLLDGAGKVSAIWWFQTPRGAVQVGDFWWNRKDELSVRAVDVRAMRWFRRWANIMGLVMEQ